MPRPLTLRDLAGYLDVVTRKLRELEARKAALQAELLQAEDDIVGLRGTRGPGRPPGKRGPGRPPGKRGPGRPKGSKNKFKRKPGQPGITDFIRKKVAKKALSVLRLAKLAANAGYKSANLPQVIRLMVGKANDLKRNPDDTITKKGKAGRPKRTKTPSKLGRKTSAPKKQRAVKKVKTTPTTSAAQAAEAATT